MLEAAVGGLDFHQALKAKEEASTFTNIRKRGVKVMETIESRAFRLLAIKESSRYFTNRYSDASKSNQPATK